MVNRLLIAFSLYVNYANQQLSSDSCFKKLDK